MAQETVRRQWLILKKLPRKPHSITASKLHRMLADEGHRVALRSVQRDLMDLSTEFPIATVDEAARPMEWFWADDRNLLDLPDMDAHTAVTFKLVATYLRQALPPAVLDGIATHFQRADAVLKKDFARALSSWPSKVRVIHHGPPVQPADVNPDVLAVVYDAVLRGRRFEATYRRRGERTDVVHQVNPFALVVRDAVLYVVGALNAHKDPVTLALHRVRGARLLDEAARVPTDFDVDRYVLAGNVDKPMGDTPLQLKVAFHPRAAPTVEETPLNRDQVVTDRSDGWKVISATVPDTRSLRGWLFSYGDLVEVIEPRELRAQFAATAAQMAAKHG